MPGAARVGYYCHALRNSGALKPLRPDAVARRMLSVLSKLINPSHF